MDSASFYNCLATSHLRLDLTAVEGRMGNTKDAGAAPDERATHIHSGRAGAVRE
jgi:hypothetical protein